MLQAFAAIQFSDSRTALKVAQRLADGLRVNEVILVALDERAYELRRDQLDGVPKLTELASHPVSARPCLHHHGAGVERGEELHQLLT